MDNKPVSSQTLANPPSVPNTSSQALVDPKILPTGSFCKNCKTPVEENEYFCPNCGKKIKDPPYKFSIGKTVGIFLESALLPPFGLIPAYKYIRINNSKAKIIGISAIIITILSLALTTIFLMNYINSVNRQLNGMTNLEDIINNPSGNVQDQAKELQQLNQ